MPSRVDPKLVQTYESLADPRLKGKICMRSSSAIYNLSLMGALIEHWGPAKAEQWVRGVVSNFARAPQGADTTLLQSVAAGECAVTLANHYYYVRLQTSKVRGEQEAAKKLTPIFPEPGRHGHAREHLGRGRHGLRAAQGQRGQVPRVSWRATRRRTSLPTPITNFPPSPRRRAPRARDAWRVQDRSAERRRFTA